MAVYQDLDNHLSSNSFGLCDAVKQLSCLHMNPAYDETTPARIDEYNDRKSRRNLNCVIRGLTHQILNNNVTMIREKVVLLACGSFNPVTNMHLRIFELARDQLHRTGKFNIVGGIISPVNDQYDKKDLVPANHRVNMLRHALASSDWIRVDPWESEQETWLETVKILRHHQAVLDSSINFNLLNPSPSKKRKLRHDNETPLDEVDLSVPNQSRSVVTNQNLISAPTERITVKLLCGADLLESFAVPGLWREEHIEDIIQNYGLVVITRGGSNPERFIYDSDLLSRLQRNIHLVPEWIPNDVSSTRIRRAIRRGESVKYLVPDDVIDYIHQHKLYGWTENRCCTTS